MTSKLEQLIEQLCPDGVEYKTTKEIKLESFWLMPATPNFINEGIPYITSKNIKDGVIDFEDVKYISVDDYQIISNNRKIEVNDLLITMIGTIGEAAFVQSELKFYGQNLYLIRLNEKIVNRKYFYYFLTSPLIKNKLVLKKNASSQGYIKAGNLESLSIPLPPLPIQEEIVRILDNMTSLTAELTAELKARQKQYEYYRDSLLSFEGKGDQDGVRWMKLGEACTLKAGKHISATEISNVKTEENQYPCYGGNGIRGFVSNFSNDGDYPIIGRQGALCGNVCYATSKFYATEHAVVVTQHGMYNERFLYYLLDVLDLNQYKSAGAQPGLAVGTLEKIIVPVPSLEEQQRIVDILDRFDKLCNDISEGLPAEIEARKKQYEYYRDKLLTFKEKEA